jgi:hypothetical protein
MELQLQNKKQKQKKKNYMQDCLVPNSPLKKTNGAYATMNYDN